MFPPHAPANRRARPGEAQNPSGVNHTAFGNNLYPVQTVPPHPRQGAQELDVNIGSQHKRVRHSSPHGSRPDVRRKLNPTMPDPSILPCATTRCFPSQIIQGGTNEEGFDEEPIVPNLDLNFLNGDMHRSMSSNDNPGLLSHKNKAAEPFVFGSTQSTKTSGSTPKNGATGTISRRRLVPGENKPWLASTFRETTSSRGKDNPLNGRHQAKPKSKLKPNVRAIAGPALMPNNSASNAATYNFNFEAGFDIVSRDSKSPPGSDKVVTPPQDWVLLDYTNTPPGTHLAPVGPNPPPVRMNTEEIAYPNFQWDPNFSNSGLEAFNPYNFAPITNTDSLVEDLFDASQINVDIRDAPSFMPQSNMDFDFLEPQGAFGFLESHNYPDGYVAIQNLNNTNDMYLEQPDDWNFLDFIQEDSGVSEQVGTSQYSQNGVLPRDFPGIYNQYGIQQEQGQQIYPTINQLPYREIGSHSLSRCSPKLGVDDPPSLSIDTTEQSNITRGIPDFEEPISSGTNSSPNTLFDSTVRTTPTDANCRSPLEDFLILTHPYSDVNTSARSPSLGDSTKSHSPLLRLTENANETQKEIQNPLAESNQQPMLKKARRSSSSSPGKTTTTWKHTFVTRNDFTDAASVPISEGNLVNQAKRKGPLGDDKKERAKEMRKIGSCHRCRILKIAKAASSPSIARICLRDRLRDFVNIFLPEPAVRAFQKLSIDRLMSEKVSGFSDNQFKIDITSGPRYKPIQISVHTFHTPDQSFLAFRKIVAHDAGDVPTFTQYYSPPLGIKDFSQDLEGKLKSHISEIIKDKRNYGEVESGSMSSLSWDMYEAVRKYQAQNPENQFLRSILTLHAMQFFMTKSITILRESSENVLNNLPRPEKLIYSYNPNLRLINIQIKHIMYTLIQKMYSSVLEQLEKDLRPKEPEQWAPTFCCIMILCMCAEMVQTTTDLRVVNALDNQAKSKSGLDKNCTSPSRDESIVACRRLDEKPIESATRIFHLVFKNNKTVYSSKRGDGFNPLHDGLDMVRNAHLGRDVEDLVKRVLDVVKNHKNELENQELTPSFNIRSNLLEDHNAFRRCNSGRLVAKFLKSLL